ncbi:MAG: 2-hydroxyacyl-CoA dehydratase [Deltaproteobacteria bacterium]|nr:2-hydroxyacyl-CoA dehydratase [Deltaproteobacteria bacterium]
MAEAPSRRAYIRKQKEARGCLVLGVFPAHYPREILLAMNILPVEIWDPPLEVSGANAHLQPYICSIVKLGLELILQGKCDDVDGFLFPHTCDSIQNLASIVYDYLDLNKPCTFFYHPKAPYRESSRLYYREQLKALVKRLEPQAGPLDSAALKGTVAQARELATLMEEVYALRASGQLAAGNREFYGIVRQGEFLHPDDYVPLVKEFIASARGSSSADLSVVMSGVLPGPPEILTVLDDLGVRVGEDDFLCCGRRLPVAPIEAEDPFEALADAYFRMPPCSTKDSPIAERLADIEARVRRSDAGGVIFNMLKFCEPELFDVPQLVAELRRKEIPTLVIDCDLNQGLSGQMATRVEAFIEMIS